MGTSLASKRTGLIGFARRGDRGGHPHLRGAGRSVCSRRCRGDRRAERDSRADVDEAPDVERAGRIVGSGCWKKPRESDARGPAKKVLPRRAAESALPAASDTQTPVMSGFERLSAAECCGRGQRRCQIRLREGIARVRAVLAGPEHAVPPFARKMEDAVAYPELRAARERSRRRVVPGEETDRACSGRRRRGIEDAHAQRRVDDRVTTVPSWPFGGVTGTEGDRDEARARDVDAVCVLLGTKWRLAEARGDVHDAAADV